MRRFTTLAAALAIGAFAGVGCKNDDTTTTSSTAASRPTTTETAAQRTGDAVRDAADKTGDALATAGEKTKEGAQAAGRKINEGAHKVADATARGFENAKEAGARIGKGTAAAPDAEGIRDVLAQVTEAALTKGGVDDMVERFVDADRNRLGQGDLKNTTELDGRIDQFRKDWKAKYNEEFDIKNEEAAFPEASFSITQGEIARANTGASVDVKKDASGDVNVDVNNKTGVDSPASPAADTNRNDPGRNVASIQVAESHGAPALQVSMIHEAPDRWKIDVPDTLTADKLKQNVLAHLTEADQPDQWPADINQAYAQVGHHILMAILDKPAK